MEGVIRELRVHEKGRARKLMQEGMWEEKGAGETEIKRVRGKRIEGGGKRRGKEGKKKAH